MDFKIKAYKGRDGLTVVFAALEISKRWNRLRTGQIQVAKLLTGTFKRDCSNLEMLYVVKAPVNLEVKKLPMAIAEATHTPVPYKH